MAHDIGNGEKLLTCCSRDSFMLEDMTVFVTGATAGFGLATVRKFAKDGAKVIGTGRRAERLADLAKDIGPNFLPLTFDVGSRQQRRKPLADCLRSLQRWMCW